jgi:hypothetical protein
MSTTTLTAASRQLLAGYSNLVVSASYAAYALDPDAAAWLTAAGIANDPAAFYDVGVYRRSGAQLWTAGDQRVKALKLAGLWHLLAGDWPLAGDSAAAHGINAVRPASPATLLQDANGPAPSFSGGFAGNQGAWFDLHIRPADLPQDSVSISIYSRLERSGVQMPLGAADAGLSTSLYLLPSFSSQNYSRANQADSQPISNAYSLGMQLLVRSAATVRAYYTRSLKVGEDGVPSVPPSTSSFYAGAANVGGEAMYKAAYLLGSWQLWQAALTQEQATAFNQIEETWQAALGRNV